MFCTIGIKNSPTNVLKYNSEGIKKIPLLMILDGKK